MSTQTPLAPADQDSQDHSVPGKKVMWMLEKSGPVLCEYDPKLLSFLYDGDEIRDPTLSPCGRFSVDPVVAYEFAKITDSLGQITLYGSVADGVLTITHEGQILNRLDADRRLVCWILIKDIPFAE